MLSCNIQCKVTIQIGNGSIISSLLGDIGSNNGQSVRPFYNTFYCLLLLCPIHNSGFSICIQVYCNTGIKGNGRNKKHCSPYKQNMLHTTLT